MTDLAEHYAALRSWAKGMYPTEAATELLIRTGWARPGLPWIGCVDKDATRPRIDFERIPARIGAYSGGEQRLLRLAASIGSDDVLVSLSWDVSGLDRRLLALVLAALAHAGGSHEHSDVALNGDGTATWKRLGSLYPWPESEQPTLDDAEVCEKCNERIEVEDNGDGTTTAGCACTYPYQPVLDVGLAARVAEDDAEIAMNRPDIL